MTIAKEKSIPQTFIMTSILTDTGPQPGEWTPPPTRYPVRLLKKGGHKLDQFYGAVVSHLALQDWCDLHGYEVLEVYAGTRPAFENERTDLF
jgi:hypothetical protein